MDTATELEIEEGANEEAGTTSPRNGGPGTSSCDAGKHSTWVPVSVSTLQQPCCSGSPAEQRQARAEECQADGSLRGPSRATCVSPRAPGLGPLPFRRPSTLGSAGPASLKEPRGLSSCVIREDLPYPPSNVETQLQVRMSTLRHGRRLIRYAASFPLDIFHVKIPNTTPDGLPHPLLESLVCQTLDFGNQRIVVGGGLRPGCALLTLDLLLMGEEEEGLEGAAAGEPDGVLGRATPAWLGALLAGEHEGGGEGASSELGERLTEAMQVLRVPMSDGMKLDLQYGSIRRQAKFDSGRGTWDVAPGSDARAAPTATAVAEAAPGAGAPDAAPHPPPPPPPPPVRLRLTHQVLVAPSAPGEALRLGVRVSGLRGVAGGVADGASAAAGALAGGGQGPDGPRYAFTLRALGRHLPVLGVCAPSTPGMDTEEGLAEGQEGVPGGSAAGRPAWGSRAPRSADSDGPEAFWGSEGCARAAPGGPHEAGCGAAAAEAEAEAAASGTDDGGLSVRVQRRPVEPVAALGAEQGHGGALGAGSIRSGESGGGRGADVAEEWALYDLTVAGLGVGGAPQGPLLLQLELWEDNTYVVAAKPLLLLPPSPSAPARAALLQSLLSEQQDLEAEEEAEAETEGREGEAVAAGARPDGLASQAPADQLLTDLGLWLEFVHLNIQEQAQAQAQPQAQAPPRSRQHGSPVLLAGSVDLGPELLAARRRDAAYSDAMLRLGLELLDAAAALGCAPLAASLLADLGALGYSLAGVWSAVAGGGLDGGSTLLHSAAASGCAQTLRLALGWAAAVLEQAGPEGAPRGPWGLRDAAGRTPCHLVAAAAAAVAAHGATAEASTGRGAVGALEWMLVEGGAGARGAWRQARDVEGQTPVEVLARGGAAWLAEHAASLLAKAAAAEGDSEDTGGPSAAVVPQQGPSARAATGPAAASAGGSSAADPTHSQPGAVAARDDGEAAYQSWLTRRSLRMARSWVVVHLLLWASAAWRVVAEGRPYDVPATLCFSGVYFVMAWVLYTRRGTASYLASRPRWWFLVWTARTSSKAVQLLGLVPTPPSMLRIVRQGATLVTDAVLPAVFEPLPLWPWVAVSSVYDTAMTAAYYMRIGYTASMWESVMRALTKVGLALVIRVLLELSCRRAWRAARRREAAAAAGAEAAGRSPGASRREGGGTAEAAAREAGGSGKAHQD